MAWQRKRMDFSRFPRRDLARDETLFVEDEESTDLYVLLQGSLGIYRDEIHVATIDEPLAIVGEISALTKRPRAASVRALHQSTVVVVEEPDELFDEYPQLAIKLAKILAGRLADTNGRFVEAKMTLFQAMRGQWSGSAEIADLPEPEDDEFDQDMTQPLPVMSEEDAGPAAEAEEAAEPAEPAEPAPPAVALEDAGTVDSAVPADLEDVDTLDDSDETLDLEPIDDAELDAETVDLDDEPAAEPQESASAHKAQPEIDLVFKDQVFDVLTDILDWDSGTT